MCAGVAQLVEQLTCNQQVVGSTPIASSIDFLKKQNFSVCTKSGELLKRSTRADCKSAG